MNPIRDLEILVELLTVDVGPICRFPNGDIRVYRRLEVDIGDDQVSALYRLRGHHLVEWGSAEFYEGSQAIRQPGGPLPVLTAVGRRLALAQL